MQEKWFNCDEYENIWFLGINIEREWVYETPWFSFETSKQIMKWINETTPHYHFELNEGHFTFVDEYGRSEVDEMEINGHMYYQMGGGMFCWTSEDIENLDMDAKLCM